MTIDGADEVDPHLDVIKGRGGALLREKIVASATRRQVIIVDETKLVAALGRADAAPRRDRPLRLETDAGRLASLALLPTVRRTETGIFRTDNGNLIVDCALPQTFDLHTLAAAIKAIVGVVDHGFFLGLTHTVVIGTANGTQIRGQQ